MSNCLLVLRQLIRLNCSRCSNSFERARSLIATFILRLPSRSQPAISYWANRSSCLWMHQLCSSTSKPWLLSPPSLRHLDDNNKCDVSQRQANICSWINTALGHGSQFGRTWNWTNHTHKMAIPVHSLSLFQSSPFTKRIHSQPNGQVLAQDLRAKNGPLFSQSTVRKNQSSESGKIYYTFHAHTHIRTRLGPAHALLLQSATLTKFKCPTVIHTTTQAHATIHFVAWPDLWPGYHTVHAEGRYMANDSHKATTFKSTFCNENWQQVETKQTWTQQRWVTQINFAIFSELTLVKSKKRRESWDSESSFKKRIDQVFWVRTKLSRSKSIQRANKHANQWVASERVNPLVDMSSNCIIYLACSIQTTASSNINIGWTFKVALKRLRSYAIIVVKSKRWCMHGPRLKIVSLFYTGRQRLDTQRKRQANPDSRAIRNKIQFNNSIAPSSDLKRRR